MELKWGYKQTEVGIIPQDWETRPLYEGVRLLSGQHVLARYCNTDGDGAPYITGPADFPQGVIQHTKFTTKPGTICRSNDILVTVKGSGAGSLVLSNADYCISRQLMAIRVTDWNTNYIYFSLVQDASLFGAAATGLIPGLSRDDILNKTIPLPPTRCEQEAIADALSDADALIGSLEQLIAKKRHLKQGAMQELLTGNRRLPGFAPAGVDFKNTDAGVIPKDWQARPLGEGVRLLSGQHVLARHCNADGDGTPYITGPSDFPEGVIHHSKSTTKPGTLCQSNDILVTVKGSGSGTMVLSDAAYCISRQLMAIRVPDWNTSYVYFSLLRDASLFNGAATGLIPGLSRSDILTKAILLPPTIAEQIAIADVLTDMDDEIAALEAKLAKARQIKQGLMHNLLTGRIRLV